MASPTKPKTTARRAPVESKASKTAVNFVATPKRPLSSNRRGNPIVSHARVYNGKKILESVKRKNPRLYTLGELVLWCAVVGLSVAVFFLVVIVLSLAGS